MSISARVNSFLLGLNKHEIILVPPAARDLMSPLSVLFGARVQFFPKSWYSDACDWEKTYPSKSRGPHSRYDLLVWFSRLQKKKIVGLVGPTSIEVSASGGLESEVFGFGLMYRSLNAFIYFSSFTTLVRGI
jgi:hypothetical protein